jgi:hypothetical protein
MPIANVLIDLFISFAATEQTRELSRPPLRRKPTFASASRRFSIPDTSLSWIFRQIISRSS